MIGHDYEQIELTKEDEVFILSLPSFEWWWNNMVEKQKRANDKWVEKKKAERAKGAYK